MTPEQLQGWWGPHLERIQALLLERFAVVWPDRLGEATRYPLSTGGKRIRPLLSLAACESLGQKAGAHALLAACAVELIHSYSLVHDDLPCMDDDALRRGKPTVHVLYGEDAALLVGDALLTEAFGMLAELPAPLLPALLRELTDAAGHRGMIGGQGADIGMAGPIDDVQTLMRLHQGKTGALIRGAVRIGGIIGGASPSQLAALTTYGEAVGLAFQLADDVLDAEQDAGDDGPPSFVRLLGVAQTQRRAAALAEEALAALAHLPSADTLAALARFTIEREL